jgi:5-methylcytosine-specific restriction endonuclease McrA
LNLPLDIFVRDGWICHICGNNVGIEDASLDHVVPIALGGDLDNATS